MTIGRITVILALVLLVLKKMPQLITHMLTSTWTISITRSNQNSANTEISCNKQWFCFNSTTKTHCISGTFTHITCSDSRPLLLFGNCATYSEGTELVTIAICPYLQVYGHMYNMPPIRHDNFIHLPKNLTELNDSMCGPMNRKGIACSECIDGFGSSVTSIGYACVKCILMPGIECLFT